MMSIPNDCCICMVSIFWRITYIQQLVRVKSDYFALYPVKKWDLGSLDVDMTEPYCFHKQNDMERILAQNANSVLTISLN